MQRFVVAVLLVVAAVEGMNVRRQAPSPDCQFPLLPVLKVCPPCQPASCYCANGKELTTADQLVAEQNKTLPCDVTPENQYGLPARCDCLPPGEGFTFQDVIGKLQAAAAAAQGAQQGQQQQQAAQSQTEAEQPKPESQPAPQQAESRQEEAAAASQPTLPVDPAAQAACPRPLLPVLNACPPCSPTDCFCADGKKLTLEDQAKAYESKTPPCAADEQNKAGLPARCNCADPGTGFTFPEILALLAKQQAELAQQQQAQQQQN